MPRSNSMSTSGGSGITSDEEAAPVSPTYAASERGRAAARSQDAEPKSPRTPRTPHDPPLGAAAARFKRVALKVMQMHRTSTLINKLSAGAEPGVDPRRPTAHALYSHIHEPCQIEVVDYSAVRATHRHFDNAQLRTWLADPLHAREPWAKVRWVHVNGVSWDVLSALALEHDIHPLALEDVLHARHTSRSKASYFSKHLFLRVLCHSTSDPSAGGITGLPRASSPVADFEEKYDDPQASLRTGAGMRQWRKQGDMETPPPPPPDRRYRNPDDDIKRQARAAKLRVLKQDDRVHVALTNFFLFLWRDGTVVTVYAKSGADFAAPISARLKARDTILRTTADASLLVESMLDLVVDEVIEVVDRYHDHITKLESAILIKPKVGLVRALHIMSGDLSMRKRSLEPIKTLIYGLRRYDVDRCVAVAASEGNDDADAPKVVGFMSHKSKIYLADVYDHLEYSLSSMESFAAVCENLISYTFNLSGYLTNETMRRLTLITMICLPLTLLTGYFGMNFVRMWSVMQHSDVLFWEIALPLMAFLLPVFMWQDIVRTAHFLKKRVATANASKAVLEGQDRKRRTR